MNEKQKIIGVDNKELILFIGIIIGVILLLIFENFFFKGRTEIIESRENAEQSRKEMADYTIEVEEKIVYTKLNDIISMMNKKDYKGLYASLKDDYKSYYFRNYQDFERFIKAYAQEEYYPKYSSYYRDEDMYYIMVDFMKSQYTRDDLLSPTATKVDTIVLQEEENGDFKFAMNGFVENIVHNKSTTVQGITFTLQNCVRNTETMKTTILVKNNSDKTFKLSTGDIWPKVIGTASAKTSISSEVELQPGQSSAVSIEYYMQYNSNREFKGIVIAGGSFNDGTKLERTVLEI